MQRANTTLIIIVSAVIIVFSDVRKRKERRKIVVEALLTPEKETEISDRRKNLENREISSERSQMMMMTLSG